MENALIEYKKLIYRELERIPIDIYPNLYQIIKNLANKEKNKNTQLKNKSLKGLWGKVEISDELFNDARKSLFNYRDS